MSLRETIERIRSSPEPPNEETAKTGICVDVNLSAQNVKKRAVRLLEALGHNESDLVYLYE